MITLVEWKRALDFFQHRQVMLGLTSCRICSKRLISVIERALETNETNVARPTQAQIQFVFRQLNGGLVSTSTCRKYSSTRL